MNKWLSKMKVKKKLLVMAGALIIGIIMVSLAGIFASFTLSNQVDNMAHNWMASTSMAHQMNTLTSEYRIQQYAHLASDSTDIMNTYEDNMEDISNEISEISAKYEAQITSEEDKALLMKARELWSQYKANGAEIIQISRAGNSEEGSSRILGTSRDLYYGFQDAISELVSYNEEQSEVALNFANLTYLSVLAIIAAVMLAAIVTSIIILRKVIVGIVKPLEDTKQVLTAVSKGDLHARMECNTKDEFGELAQSVNNFAEDLALIINDEKYLLNEMSNGNFNLKTDITDKYIGDYEVILISMRGIRDNLSDSMLRMSQSSGQVTSAAEHLANASQELAQGATDQASTVEELFASVEEAASKAKAGAQNASEASGTADTVRNQAENSNDRMKEMITAMDKINSTSKEISGIIEAIENIASQTNLLSLNASIEAARAGEAGKGFAVVADAIGKLALQSTEAAGSTRALIEASIKETNNGDSIAKMTAEELQSVLEGINKIVEVTDEVRVRFEEQSQSMDEISKGIEIISHVVEENASSAQESSATSEELAAQAETLQLEMSKFKFRD